MHLRNFARAPETQRRLNELLFVYGAVTLPPRAAVPWHALTLDRTNAKWREVLSLARLLLSNRFQTTSVGDSQGFALLFEMNTLFEEFVGRTLRQALSGSDLNVTLQGPRRYALRDLVHGGPLFATLPDIVVSQAGKPILIIDTKWKRLIDVIATPRHGVGQADIYQMMAYAQVYSCANLMLVYPHHIGLLLPAGCLAAQSIANLEGSRLRLVTLDLNFPETVRDQLLAATKGVFRVH